MIDFLVHLKALSGRLLNTIYRPFRWNPRHYWTVSMPLSSLALPGFVWVEQFG